MAYDKKPGQGAIFKNEKRTSENQPNYYGSIVTPSGEELDVALWIKEAKSGQKYFSVSVKEPRRQDAPAQPVVAPAPQPDNDLPF